MPNHYLELDHTNLTGLLSNQHLLTESQRGRLDDIEFRIGAFPQRFARSDWYSKQAGLLALADWPHSDSFSRCGFSRRPCKQWKFCPACAYQMGARSWQVFSDAFNRTQWHFLTVSYRGGLILREPFWCDLGLYWDAGAFAVRDLVRSGIFFGAIKVEEVSLLDVPKLRVRPHLHFLVAAVEVAESTLAGLNERILGHALDDSLQREGVGAGWGPPVGIELQPSIHCRPVESADGLRRVLSYMAKPIDLFRPYSIAATRSGPEDMWEVNLAMADFLAGHTCHIDGRRQREAWGILDPRRRSGFIGARLGHGRPSHDT